MKPFDPIQIANRLSKWAPFKRDQAKIKLLEFFLNFGIPFSSSLKLKFKKFSPEEVSIVSKELRARKNHIGTAHACAQALMGEQAAGLILIQAFPSSKYRVVIKTMTVEYKKSGKGTLVSTAQRPSIKEFENQDEFEIKMASKLTDSKGDVVAIVNTVWNLKSWKSPSKK